MRYRPSALLVLLAAVACQDTPITPPAAAPAEPRFMVVGGGATDLRSGYDYACVLRSGVITCFGEGDEGQPIGGHRAATGTFVQLGTGATHACGLRSDGAVECWGSNDFGKAPALRRAATGSFTAVSGGLSHSCAVRNDGIVECWGSNEYGQAPAVKAAQTGRFTQVNASAATTCALRSDGVVECWGRREAAPPVKTAPSGTYVKLGDGIANTNCAVTSTGVADCWGYRAGYRAGPYTQVVVGGGHTCALRTNGSADCWGYPFSWEGPGERTVAESSVITSRTWSRITAGTYHTCALRGDGYFECFGMQAMGSNAPDVIPVADAPGSAPTTTWRIRLAWRDVNTNELRTEIERSVADRARNPTSWTRVGTLAAPWTIFVDSVAPGAVYLHRVRVCNNAGCSPWEESNATAIPVAMPPAPNPVTASGYVCSYESCARLAWAVDNTFVETFRLQRRVNTGSGYGAWQDLPIQDRAATSYEDYALVAGASYQYRVRACNGRGCSGFGTSNAFVAPRPAPPSAPADLSAAAMGNYMYLAWGDVANETTYELQRRQHDGTAYGAWSEPIVRTMNNTRHEDPVPPGGLYQYRIRACNQGGCSAYTSSAPARS